MSSFPNTTKSLGMYEFHLETFQSFTSYITTVVSYFTHCSVVLLFTTFKRQSLKTNDICDIGRANFLNAQIKINNGWWSGPPQDIDVSTIFITQKRISRKYISKKKSVRKKLIGLLSLKNK